MTFENYLDVDVFVKNCLDVEDDDDVDFDVDGDFEGQENNNEGARYNALIDAGQDRTLLSDKPPPMQSTLLKMARLNHKYQVLPRFRIQVIQVIQGFALKSSIQAEYAKKI